MCLQAVLKKVRLVQSSSYKKSFVPSQGVPEPSILNDDNHFARFSFVCCGRALRSENLLVLWSHRILAYKCLNKKLELEKAPERKVMGRPSG